MNTKNPKIARDFLIQGDVIAQRIPSLPDGAKPRKDLVIAEGEATGHNHVLTGGTKFIDEKQNIFCVVEEQDEMLLHQEHGPWVLTPGVYQFGISGVTQVEYLGDEERRALD